MQRTCCKQGRKGVAGKRKLPVIGGGATGSNSGLKRWSRRRRGGRALGSCFASPV